MRTFLAAVSVAAAVLGAAVAPQALAVDPHVTTPRGGYVPVGPTRVWNAVTVGPHVTKNVRITGGSTGVPTSGVGAVAATISVLGSNGTGFVLAYAAGAHRPETVNLQVTPGGRTADLALIVPGTNDNAAIFNNSSGTVSLAVDISGYYVRGATSAVKSYHPVKATRTNDVTISANDQANPILGGKGPIPGFNVGAVAVTLTERTATKSGYLGAKAYQLPIAGTKVLHWTAGKRASAFAIVPVDATGRLTLTNYSAGSVEIAIDVVGYFLQGAPHEAGMLNNVPTARLWNAVPLASETEGGPSLSGHAGIARSGVRAVVLTVTVTAPRAGSVLVYSGDARPKAATVQFAGHQTTSDTAIVDLRGRSAVSIYNHSPDTAVVTVDVTGWILDATNEVPPTQVGRYVRNLVRGKKAANASAMRDEGDQDATSHLVLLDIGAQRNDKSGVQLSATKDEKHHIDYEGLVDALAAYVDAYAAADGQGTILVGTSNSADDWTGYTAKARGKDWWSRVVKPLTGRGVAVVGASDIEPGFGTGRVSDALAWKKAYQGSAPHPFVFNGSADDCPVDFNKPNRTCLNGWTEKQLYTLASGPRTTALPQIYNSRMAIQWTNIDQTGDDDLVFAGALTENPVDGTYPAQQGWAALRNGLATRIQVPYVPAVVELHVDD